MILLNNSPAPNMLPNNANVAMGNAPAQRAGESLYLTPAIRSTKVTITSPNNASAVETTVYLFNNDWYQNVTSNGGATITYNYEDGFGGIATSRMITSANGSQGQTLYGGYIKCYADGVADSTGLSNSEPLLIQYIGRGTASVPTLLEVDDNESRSDFSQGIGVFTCKQPFNNWTQFQLNINGDATVDYVITVKLYFYPNFKI